MNHRVFKDKYKVTNVIYGHADLFNWIQLKEHMLVELLEINIIKY